MPEHGTRAIILGGLVEHIRKLHVHTRRHRVFLGRTIQFNAKNVVGTLGNNLVHFLPYVSVTRFRVEPRWRTPSNIDTISLYSG